MINFLYQLTGDLYVSVIIGVAIYASLFFDIIWLFVKPKNQLNFIVTLAVVSAIVTSTTILGLSVAASAAIIGVTTGLLVYGGMALSAAWSKKASNFDASSATYANPTLQTQTNPDLPVPLLYGTVKLAGNRIWQDDNTKNGIKRIVAFAEGEIVDFTDIRLNDVKSNEISGIKIQKFYGTSTQGLPSVVDSETVGSLKNIAYLYINVPKGEKIDINYNLTAIVKGRKIRVYTTPTTYTIKYSENPAWVLFDFLTCYNGRGLCLDDDGTLNDTKVAELFDLNSFIEAAAFCDEIVLTDGKASPRFTFNMIFDSQTSHRTLLDEIYRNCRGVLAVKNGKLQFKIDKAEATKKVFNDSDIIDGSETFQTLPHEEHYDILKLDYISPEHEWQKVQAFAEIPEYRDGVPIEHQVNCYSVTNFQQASRLAWYYINSKVLCPYFGSFQTGFKGADLEVGDVISIPVILMGLSNYLVKVTSVIDNGTGVYTVNYRTYDTRLYNDTLGSKKPTAIVTVLDNTYNFPDDVQNFNVVQNNDLYSFTWQYTNDTDLYEIRYGDEWETAEIIGKGLTLNEYSYPIKSTGLKKFLIKAKNNYNYSENATMDVINITDVPEQNVVVNYDVASADAISTLNTKKYRGQIKLNLSPRITEYYDGNDLEGTLDGNDLSTEVDGNYSSQDIIWHTTQDVWGSGDTYYQNGGIWGASVYTYGYYTSQVYDLEGIVSSSVNFEASYTSVDADATVLFEWRYSEDNTTWTEWTPIALGVYSFRYSQYRMTFISPNGVQTVVTKFNVIVDVPDKFEYLDVDVNNANGKIIYYDFFGVPSIVATVNDDITAYAVVTAKTNKQATIKVYNNNGTATTGNVSLYLKGY